MSYQTLYSISAAVVGFISATFFCIGNIANSAEKITLQSTPFWDFNEHIARSLVAQKAQYATGGIFLVVAFFLQIFAALSIDSEALVLPTWLQYQPTLISVMLLPTAISAWLICRCIQTRTMGQVALLQQEQMTQDAASNPSQ
ncbi:MAG: hypothetical protein Q7T39_00155 [Polaromonas sp.]|nr:hypothetical protein [Polaromonas sp.]